MEISMQIFFFLWLAVIVFMGLYIGLCVDLIIVSS